MAKSWQEVVKKSAQLHAFSIITFLHVFWHCKTGEPEMHRPFLITLILCNPARVLAFCSIASVPSSPAKTSSQWSPPSPPSFCLRDSISRKSRVPTRLYNLFDAVGEMLRGPRLEPETKLPYSPPFSEELSIAGHVRTFAIKERP